MADNNRHKTTKALAWLTLLGFNMISPLIICVLAAAYLRNKFNLGNWIMIIAVVIGAASGYMSLVNFIRAVKKYDEKEEINHAE